MSKFCMVRCKNKTSVRLPDGVIKNKGDSLPCPVACSKRSRCTAAVREGSARSFAVDFSDMFDKSAANASSFIRYSEEEVRAAFGAILAQNAGQAQGREQAPNADASASAAQAAQPRPASLSAPGLVPAAGTAETEPVPRQDAVHRLSMEETLAKFNGGAADADAVSAGVSPNPVQSQTSGEGDTPFRINVNGAVFSDDPELRQRNRSVRPLRYALWEIFNYWVTPAVFSPSELRDDFRRLLEILRRRPDESRVKEILHAEYSVSQKFFYLFYDVIYRYDPPKGFYWCDRSISPGPLSALFIDRDDFTRKYCEQGQNGSIFRTQYRRCKREVLHFLKYDSMKWKPDASAAAEGELPDDTAAMEESLFEDAALTAAKQSKRAVLLERDAADNYEPVDLGSLAEFAKSMYSRPDFARMQNMLAYLKKFRVYKGRAEKRAAPLRISKRPEGFVEPECVYEAAGLSASARYADEFDGYMTLLREYTEAFSPSEIVVGELKFTKSGFSGEVRALVFSFCKLYFGQADDYAVRRAQGRALLAGSIIKRKVLAGFECENGQEIERLLALAAEPSCEQYFSAFREPLFNIGGQDITLREYIEQLLDTDAFRACGALQSDERVRAFYAARLGGVAAESAERHIRSQTAEYERQFDEFLKDAEKIGNF